MMSVMTARLSPLTAASSDSPEEIAIGEAGLVHAAGAGDRSAFETLYARYARMVHGILLARVRPSDAEDLVQDVFLTAFRKVSRLRSPGAFAGWLAAIARNRAVEYHRALRHDADAFREARPSRLAHPDTGAFEALEIIRQLPEAYHETLILRLVEGMTGPEIAERTGLTPDSVRVNLFRGMKLLRERLGAADRPRGGASR
jgi:RNA polymerase sigma-70 factor, ECF subfamily